MSFGGLATMRALGGHMWATAREGRDGPVMPVARRKSGWRILAAGAALAAMTVAGHAPASAATRNWIATGWNIHVLSQADPATARHFFDAPSSYGVGASLTASRVPAGFAATAVL